RALRSVTDTVKHVPRPPAGPVGSQPMAAPNRPRAAASVTFRCHGHPHISGSHTKTVELTRDPEVTGRATCVLGVSSEHDDRELRRLRGDVEVTLDAAGVQDTFMATTSAFFLG